MQSRSRQAPTSEISSRVRSRVGKHRLVTADCAYRSPPHAHLTPLYHSRHDRSREGRKRKEVRLGRCGANDAYGGDKEWRHRDRAVGFVDSTGEASRKLLLGALFSSPDFLVLQQRDIRLPELALAGKRLT